MSVRENVPPDDTDAVRGRWKRLARRAEKLASDAPNVALLRQISPNRLPPPPAAPEPELPATGEPNEEKKKAAALIERLQGTLNRKADGKRNWGVISALVCIALPTFLAALYYLIFAADLYVSEARFAVRTNESQSEDVLGQITGLPSTSVISDSYIVADYILSPDLVRQLEGRIPLRQMFAHSDADFLKKLDPTVTLEHLVAYWGNRVEVFYDFTKNAISVRSQAFSAADAQIITQGIVDLVRNLVNDLSAQARRDAVQFASSELARAELRVRNARDDLIRFRAKNNNFDPAQTASAAIGIVGKLESERSQLSSQLAAVSGYLGPNAPSVQMLTSRINALEAEIGRIQGAISESDAGKQDGLKGVAGLPASGAFTTVVADYQELLLNQEFAEKAYTAALGSLERARSEADRAQSYLAIYVQPNVPEQATYPQRFLNIFVVLLLASIIWAIGSLAFLTARDHIM
ncbi:MAG: capsule biosynthesis protein [Pseudomonadota bacterium]|nr:capsule biosynthesis protein [Pseudomonadota bacterium]